MTEPAYNDTGTPTVGKNYVVLGDKFFEKPTSFCTTYGWRLIGGAYGEHTIHNGTCNDCKKKRRNIAQP